MFFKSRSSDPSDLASLRQEVNNALTKLRAEEEKLLGRHIVLRPTVPLSTEGAVGWFGGSPKLPETQSWPSIDGDELIFLAQVDLSKVPGSTWRGTGPREGHLVFFVHPKNIKARVLHVRGPLVEAMGPSPFHSQHVRDIEDMHPRRVPSFIEDQNFFPKWPVMLESGLPSDPVRTAMALRKGDHPDCPIPFPYGYGLTNRALRPFDGATLAILIDELGKAFEERMTQIDKFMEEKKLTKNTQDALEAIKSETQATAKEFAKFVERLRPFLDSFDSEKVGAILDEIAELPHGLIDYRGDDPFGYAVIHIALGDLSNRLKYKWKGGDYPKALRKRVRYAYVNDPESLPREIRERFEKQFQYEAFYEFGAMSHLPDRDTGNSYDPIGEPEPLLTETTEVLLELSTSELLGWMFGDMYSLVFFISQDDLDAGNFGNVFTTVTN